MLPTVAIARAAAANFPASTGARSPGSGPPDGGDRPQTAVLARSGGYLSLVAQGSVSVLARDRDGPIGITELPDLG
ncbi:hypothetical protein JJD41_13800 [Oxynema sp. CENA135]|uniref:hypothetical protein n=1 Tax=Oxynema sp. CENA135 TaxID=984206 RepID=UPI00190BD073|nr:hypothetical protein [Oxynema sp. CENA135]MBK4730926.1 hypothetical protein [Oxynema sp. CENA135]